ncbi:hypothetical protein [Pengzhenrongella frigida]|uniref:Uncharacterized protein n=1 Tax=Pengzhenrongella frigida TaxID=1259133 RepID=A0A4Q5N409_9MICO|nr:hypothetical protein [Cellulomonas sp. HLT2-17]RYV52999.1 hypothetical protein EUA98_00465 [Cellulomonas sp. HLT2-17]
MATDHRARPDQDVPPGDTASRGSREKAPNEGPMPPFGLALRGAAVVVGLYLVWLGAQGSPMPGRLGGGADRAGWVLAGPGAWSAGSVVPLAAGVFAILVGGIGLLSNLPIGGASRAAFRARVRHHSTLLMFGLAGAVFTAALVTLAVLWSTGVAYRNYEVDDTVAGGAMYGILIGVCAILAGVGWGSVISAVRGPARTLQPGERLPVSRLILRPFGYFAMGTIWVALWLIILAMAAALPIALSDRHPIGLADTPLSAAAGIVDLQANPLKLILVVVLLGPPLALLFGWIVGMFALTAWPLAALSFVYFARSLRPSYAGEALSGTSRSTEAIGPLTITSKAMSLLPVRGSWLTDVLMKAYIMGWTPTFRLIGSCFWLGLGYLFATIWFAWPVTNPVVVALFAVVSLGLAGYTVYRLVAFGRAIPGLAVRTRDDAVTATAASADA